MDFALSDLQKDIQSQVRDLSNRYTLEYWLEHDRAASYPWEFFKDFAQAGWLGAVIPEQYGGSGLGIVEASIILNTICASGAGTSGASPVHFAYFPAMPIIKFGSDTMKARYLPAIATGELLMAFGVTEPTSGSDTSRIQTRADRRQGGWNIYGQKVWTTNAQHAGKVLLLARTAPRDDQQPLEGMTLFLADLDRRYCSVRVIEKLGRAAVDSNEVFIDGLPVEDADVVGKVGEGFRHLLESLNPERIVIAMEAAGIGRAAIDLASRYAKERVVFGRPIGANQAVAHPLAWSWASIAAAETLALKAAWLYDQGLACASEANSAKLVAAEAGFKACDAALQTLGGFGYAREYHVERLWREVRLYRIAPISQEMVLNFLAHHELKLPRSY
jgi:acyl-CoA dehydrogenase